MLPASSGQMLSLSSLSAASLSSTKLTSALTPLFNTNNKAIQRRIRNVRCKAELTNEAPLVVAIGGCILNSLVFPETPERDDEDEDGEESSVIDSTDARMAVMGIISLIPYFNWLSWVFAWLDTGKQRYLVYALVYLAPYLRTNLSILPDESWLPIASIFLCIIHLQLEASIRNGDLQGFQLFRGPSITGRRKSHSQSHYRVSKEEEADENMNLPPAQDQSRDEIQGWGVPEKPSLNLEQLNEDGDLNNKKKH